MTKQKHVVAFGFAFLALAHVAAAQRAPAAKAYGLLMDGAAATYSQLPWPKAFRAPWKSDANIDSTRPFADARTSTYASSPQSFETRTSADSMDKRTQCPMPVSRAASTASMPTAVIVPKEFSSRQSANSAVPTDQKEFAKSNIGAMRQAMPCNNPLDGR